MLTLEFTLDPADIPRLTRWPGVRAARAFPLEITWHDTTGFDLANQNLALSQRARIWFLTPLDPRLSAIPEPPPAEARHPSLLGHTLPESLELKAVFRGRRQSLRWTGPAGETALLTLLQGRCIPGPDVCAVTLEGLTTTIGPLATTLAASLGLHVPRASLTQRALAAAGHPPPLPTLGAPSLTADLPVNESLAAIIGHLLGVMLQWADQIPGALTPGALTPEPVHQMRVAIRRLRSALSVFRPAAPCPELTALSLPLRACATHLGAARDWDVFLESTAPHLTASLGETISNDPRYPAMLRAAARRRRHIYAGLQAYLAGPEFRTLAAGLACAVALRPWDDPANPATKQATSLFAVATLSHRLRHVHKSGRHIERLPLPALHELRKDCKRLRYAAEFFRPLLPAAHAKRYLARLSDLQEELGLLNDTTSITGLMAQLGRPHTFAAGLVEGFAAAGARPARTRIARRWKTFRQAKPFW